MIQNIKTKHEKLKYLKFIKKTAEGNLKHAMIVQNASTQDLIETREHLIQKIVEINHNQKSLNNSKKFYGLIHHAGKKLYIKCNDFFVKKQLANLTQALTCVTETLNARSQKRNIDAVSNINLQIRSIENDIKATKQKKLSEFAPQK